MITNKDIRVENGFLIINGDKFPLDGQSPETIMEIVEDNSDTTPTENSAAPVTSGGVFTALAGKEDLLTFDTAPTADSTNPVTSAGIKTYVDTAIGDLTQTGITGADVAAQLTTAYDKVKRLTPVDDNYTCQSTNLEYTGLSVSCPAGHLYIIRAQLSYSNSEPTEICACSSSSNVQGYTTYARAENASFITFMLIAGETAYIWGKWATANKQNAVRYNIIDITI